MHEISQNNAGMGKTLVVVSKQQADDTASKWKICWFYFQTFM